MRRFPTVPSKTFTRGLIVVAVIAAFVIGATWGGRSGLAQKGGGAAPPGESIGPVGFTSTLLLETSETVAGQPIRFPQGENQFVLVLAEIAPGGQSGWHQHPHPPVAYILEGQIEVETEGHGTRTFVAGDSFAEVVDTWHNGRNHGSVPVRILMVFATQAGAPTAVHAE